MHSLIASALRHAGAVLAEAARAARAQLLASVVIMLLVGGLVAGVLVVVGQSAASEERVLGQIDAVGTRTILVRMGQGPPLDGQFLALLGQVNEVEHAVGFGPIRDGYPAAMLDGPGIAVRSAFGYAVPGYGDLTDLPHGVKRGITSTSTAALAGFAEGSGTLVQGDGVMVEVVGIADLPEYLRFLEPVVLLPRSTEAAAMETNAPPLTLIVINAQHPSQVRGIEAFVRAHLADVGLTSATVETSTALAELRAAVSGELGGYTRTVVLGALLVGTGLVCVSVFATTSRHRKDFGRRRAIGANRTLVAGLILAQVGLPATAGSVIAALVTSAAQALLGRPLGSLSFTLSLITAAVFSAVLAALVPAAIAARREPLSELRVP